MSEPIAIKVCWELLVLPSTEVFKEMLEELIKIEISTRNPRITPRGLKSAIGQIKSWLIKSEIIQSYSLGNFKLNRVALKSHLESYARMRFARVLRELWIWSQAMDELDETDLDSIVDLNFPLELVPTIKTKLMDAGIIAPTDPGWYRIEQDVLREWLFQDLWVGFRILV